MFIINLTRLESGFLLQVHSMSDLDDIVYKIIEFGSTDYESELALRDKVLRKPLGIELSLDRELEKGEIHFGAFYNGSLVACLVVKTFSDSSAKIRQMAVEPEFRAKGIGASLMKAAESYLETHGVRSISLNAREYALEFYLKLGYQVVGERFTEVGIPHFKAVKSV